MQAFCCKESGPESPQYSARWRLALRNPKQAHASVGLSERPSVKAPSIQSIKGASEDGLSRPFVASADDGRPSDAVLTMFLQSTYYKAAMIFPAMRPWVIAIPIELPALGVA